MAFALAVLIGISLGALGSGGSIVTLPVLVYAAHIPLRSAVGMSMAIVGATSAFAGCLHGRRGDFHRKAALLMGSTGIIGAYLGSAFTHAVSPSTLMLMFAGLMFITGGMMLSGRFQDLAPGQCRPALCCAVGLVVGILTGFLGVGGGFLLVPALVLLAGLDTKKAVGTSLAIIALNSLSGLLGQLRYAPIDWGLTAAFLACALLGMWIGLTLTVRVSELTLRRIFAVLLLLMAMVVASSPAGRSSGR